MQAMEQDQSKEDEDKEKKKEEKKEDDLDLDEWVDSIYWLLDWFHILSQFVS